jgi:hypothetical protein
MLEQGKYHHNPGDKQNSGNETLCIYEGWHGQAGLEQGCAEHLENNWRARW